MTQNHFSEKYSLRIALIAFLLWVVPDICLVQEHEPDLIWLTLHTPHFSIHFPTGYEPLARKIAGICEEIYEPVSRSLHYHPGRTHVVVFTRSNISNGLAAPLPWRIELQITEPQENWLGSRDQWLRVLLIHEFTHIVHLRKNQGLTRLTYPLFGELNSFWQGMTPRWFLEGFATYNETRFTRGGRGRNPYFFMEMMAPSQAGHLWRLENTNYISRKKLPVGMFYVSGYYLSNFIAKRHGVETWSRILDLYSRFPVSGFGHALKQVTGISLPQVYQEMMATFKDEEPSRKMSSPVMIWFQGRKQGDHREAGERIPENAYSPRWISKDHLGFYHSSFDELPAMMQIDRNGNTKLLLQRRLTSESNNFDIGPRYLVWAELHPHLRFNATNYSDVKIMELKTKKIRVITHNRRIFSVDLSPDENRIVAVENVLPETRLVIIERASGKIRPLLQVPHTTILNPRWSSDGHRIAFAMKDSTGRQDIAVLNLRDGAWRYLYPPDEFHDNNPCWSPDDRFVYFSSDRSGIFNIWAVDVHSGIRWQVTDVSLGAFTPDVSPDGKELAFSNYSYSGFKISTLPLNPKTWRAEDSLEVFTLPESISPPSPPEMPHHGENVFPSSLDSYNPFTQILRPQGWLPMVFKHHGRYSPGLVALSEDVLHRHFWQADFGYSFQTRRPFYDLFYRYSRYWPRFGINFYRTPRKIVYRQYVGWWHEQGFFATVSIPLTLERNVYTTFLQPFLGYQYENQNRVVGMLYPRYPHYRGFRLGLQFYRTATTWRDVVPQHLIAFTGIFDWTHPELHSQYKGHQLSLRLNGIFPTFLLHHQLQLFSAYQARRSTYPFGLSESLPLGYEDDGSRQQFRFKVAYHFPIAYLEWPIFFLPVYVDYLSGALFHDWATTWNHGIGRDRWRERGRFSSGGQITISAILFQFIPVRFVVSAYYRSAYGDVKLKADFFVNFP